LLFPYAWFAAFSFLSMHRIGFNSFNTCSIMTFGPIGL
jgi:hypothetical protein